VLLLLKQQRKVVSHAENGFDAPLMIPANGNGGDEWF